MRLKLLPVGKYNGRYIVGFRVQLIIAVDHWLFVPYLRWNFGEPFLKWLVFTIRFNQEFGKNYDEKKELK
jgi:hypothetical protein